MNNARTEILSRLRANKSLSTENESHPKDWGCSNHFEKTTLAQEITENFIEMANAAGMSVSLLVDKQNLPETIRNFLQENQLPAEINISDHALEQIEWSDSIKLQFGAYKNNDAASLIHAFAGIAETGTIVSLSNKTLSTSSLFLSSTCLFLLNANTIEACLEDIMKRIKMYEQPLPRTINLITGPSRTGDIEQTIQIGAHGPSRVHIFILNS